MSKKNSLAKRKKHHEYQIRMEHEAAELARKRAEKRIAKGEPQFDQHKLLNKKKPKVAAVLSNEAKKAKKSKKALAK